jgi:hypothetical protein
MAHIVNSNIAKNLPTERYHGITKQTALILNSADDLRTNIRRKSPNGDSFRIDLDTPLVIPPNAASVTVALYQANVWNSSPNVLVGKNNLFYYSIGAGAMKTIALEQGLYSLTELNSTLAVLIQNAGDPRDSVTLFGNTATQRVEITAAAANTKIYFDQPQSLRFLLGFEAQVYTIVAAGNTIIAPNVANLNTINAFLIQLDVLDNGIPVNNASASILAQVPILAKPNSLITYEPKTPIKIQCDSWIGRPVSTLIATITNEQLEPIIVVEDWNFTIMVEYSK